VVLIPTTRASANPQIDPNDFYRNDYFTAVTIDEEEKEEVASPVDDEDTDKSRTLSEEDEESQLWLDKEGLEEMARLRAYPRQEMSLFDKFTAEPEVVQEPLNEPKKMATVVEIHSEMEPNMTNEAMARSAYWLETRPGHAILTMESDDEVSQ